MMMLMIIITVIVISVTSRRVPVYFEIFSIIILAQQYVILIITIAELKIWNGQVVCTHCTTTVCIAGLSLHPS